MTFNNNNNFTTEPDPQNTNSIQDQLKANHRTIAETHLLERPNNKVLNAPAPDVDKTGETLDRQTRCRLA